MVIQGFTSCDRGIHVPDYWILTYVYKNIEVATLLLRCYCRLGGRGLDGFNLLPQRVVELCMYIPHRELYENVALCY